MKDLMKNLMENESLKPELKENYAVGPSVELTVTPIEGEMEDGNFEIAMSGSFRSGGMTREEVVNKISEFWKTIDVDATGEKKEEKKDGAEERKPEDKG